jgi:hypothetical protein
MYYGIEYKAHTLNPFIAKLNTALFFMFMVVDDKTIVRKLITLKVTNYITLYFLKYATHRKLF